MEVNGWNYLDIQGTILSTVKDGHIHLIQIPEEAVNTSGLSETAVSMPIKSFYFDLLLEVP